MEIRGGALETDVRYLFARLLERLVVADGFCAERRYLS